MANPYSSNGINNFKFSDEELELLRHSCLDDSTKIISYFEEQKSEQQKRDNINLVVSIIAMIASVISVIIGLIALFI